MNQHGSREEPKAANVGQRVTAIPIALFDGEIKFRGHVRKSVKLQSGSVQQS
jgi:hypothetical protein